MPSYRTHDTVDKLLAAGQRLAAVRRLRADLPGVVADRDLAAIEQELLRHVQWHARKAAGERTIFEGQQDPYKDYAPRRVVDPLKIS